MGKPGKPKTMENLRRQKTYDIRMTTITKMTVEDAKLRSADTLVNPFEGVDIKQILLDLGVAKTAAVSAHVAVKHSARAVKMEVKDIVTCVIMVLNSLQVDATQIETTKHTLNVCLKFIMNQRIPPSTPPPAPQFQKLLRNVAIRNVISPPHFLLPRP